MPRLLPALIVLTATATAGRGQVQPLVAVTADGWSVAAEGPQGPLSVAHENIGVVLKAVRLNVQAVDGLRPLSNWSLKTKGTRQLSITTAQPPTAWIFELGPNELKISSTSADAVLTAQAAASTDRVVARLLDPQGAPVTWQGTQEVVSSYGGRPTRNPSFLPVRNPECMYFALGQVSGSAFHSLFDRKTDTAISFSEQTLMQRNRRDRNLMDITIAVPGNTLIRLIPEYFTKTLGVPFYAPFDDAQTGTPPVVWSSWTSYYAAVTEQDIVRNADWIAAHLKPYGFEYVVLDDGYDRGYKNGHYWIENWDRNRFPHGPQWLTGYIKSKGLHAGLWLVPNAYAGALEQHPDWYLRDNQGKPILDYDTPALDSTNPEVLSFLKTLFTTLTNWGFEYFKFDGEHALPRYAPAVDRDRLYGRSIDPIVAYRNRLKLIRETIGPRTFLEGCPAGTPLNGIGFFNAYFNGQDIYNTWRGMHALFSSINGNAFLNHLLVYLMPAEGIDLEPSMSIEEAGQRRNNAFVERVRRNDGPNARIGSTLAEARTQVTYLALTGVAYPVVSVMPELPPERVDLLKRTLPTMPIVPIDLFSRGTDAKYGLRDTEPDEFIHNYPEILNLKVNAKSGVYDVAGLTNWRSYPAARVLSFADKLGLERGSARVVFDFWKQKLLGVFKDRMQVEIEPHDTRVLLIHPVLNRPQLIGLSRHITGAYSILDLSWDAPKNTLRGSSETVPGEPYSLWVYVPAGVELSSVRALTRGGGPVAAHHKLTGRELRVDFNGQPEPIQWDLTFTGPAGK